MAERRIKNFPEGTGPCPGVVARKRAFEIVRLAAKPRLVAGQTRMGFGGKRRVYRRTSPAHKRLIDRAVLRGDDVPEPHNNRPTPIHTLNDLSEETRLKVIELLNQSLADGIDLQMQIKQADWNVKGADFIGVHELLDKIAEGLGENIDEIAERGA